MIFKNQLMKEINKVQNKEQYKFEPKFDILERKGHLIKKVKLKEVSLVKIKDANQKTKK